MYWDRAFFVGPGLSVEKPKRMNSHSPKKQKRFQAYRFDNFSKYQGRTYQTSFAHVRILADGKLAAKHLYHGEVIMCVPWKYKHRLKRYIFYRSIISHQKWCIFFFYKLWRKYSPLGASWSDLCCPQRRSLLPSFQFPTRPLFAFHTFWKFPKCVPYLKTDSKNSRSRLQIR